MKAAAPSGAAAAYVPKDGWWCWQSESNGRPAAYKLAPFGPLLAHLSGALAAIGEAARTGDLELFRSGVRDLRNACIAYRDSDAEGGANVSARQFIGVLITGTLTGMGFATLFIHVMTGGCIP